jgi:hypothetical protein
MDIRRKIALGAAAVAIPALLTAGGPAQASTRVNWDARALSALTAFERHPGSGRLDQLVVDGFHLPAKPDQADLDQLAADYYGGYRQDLGLDEQYAYEDLTGGSGS